MLNIRPTSFDDFGVPYDRDIFDVPEPWVLRMAQLVAFAEEIITPASQVLGLQYRRWLTVKRRAREVQRKGDAGSTVVLSYRLTPKPRVGRRPRDLVFALYPYEEIVRVSSAPLDEDLQPLVACTLGEITQGEVYRLFREVAAELIDFGENAAPNV